MSSQNCSESFVMCIINFDLPTDVAVVVPNCACVIKVYVNGATVEVYVNGATLVVFFKLSTGL